MDGRKAEDVKEKAATYNVEGLECYEKWEVEDAITRFKEAVRLAPDDPEYHLNLARARARFGQWEEALTSLRDFIDLESDTRLRQRFRALFEVGMDPVESALTRVMTNEAIPLEEISAAMQMWWEFRIAAGRRNLPMRKPEAWASALDYIIRKLNFRQVTQVEMANKYEVSVSALRSRYQDLVETLDIMPCDYRYFRGEKNPLDMLVQAAIMLDQLEKQFRET
ncbi:MAG: tetratricopeptide repeat protein [Anaerolineae bacterium]|nr:tetratricopeptide repeat protein [Anaerolineae bacterium]NIN93681.1 tetratricopeptide repeat protein [Anaerolineae bacterium]NIQ76728.1 tetratricopeptide repeat protein [Anaerolineae bacterium]